MRSQSFTIAITAFVAALLCAVGSASEATSEQRMNVLFLVSDDLDSWLLGDANRYAGNIRPEWYPDSVRYRRRRIKDS